MNNQTGIFISYIFLNFLVLSCAGHECGFPGCKSVLVLDGNMKNRRDVCAASEAGFTEYEGLPGVIKTGCQLSPGYQSKYCYTHAPRISHRTGGEEQTDVCAEEGIVRLITAKKQTHTETYYQVHMCNTLCTWNYIPVQVTMHLLAGCLAWS